MSWIDEYDEPTLQSGPEKSALRKTAEFAGFPKTASWLAGEYAGRPESAPGALYDILPEVGNYITSIPGAAKTAAYIPAQMYRRHAISKAYPEVAEALGQLGNPITNAWQKLKGVVPEAGSVRRPSPALSMEMADQTPGFQGAASRARNWADEVLGSWGVEIPYNPVDTKFPLTFITHDAENKTLPTLAKLLNKSSDASKDTQGLYNILKRGENSYLTDYILARSKPFDATMEQIGRHETGHMVFRRGRNYPGMIDTPEAYVQDLQKELMPRGAANQADKSLRRFGTEFGEQNIPEVGYLERSDVYKKLPIHKKGEEAWTRYNAGETPWNPGEEAVISMPQLERRLSEATENLMHPSWFQSQTQMPTLPGGLLGGIEDYW